MYRKIIIPTIPLISLILLLEFLVRFQLVPNYLVPAPSEVLLSLNTDYAVYFTATLQTVSAAFLGLMLSFVCGVVMAALFQLSPMVHQAVFPYTVLFQTVPIIAIAPLLVIWFGFGFYTVFVSAFIVSLFPILAGSMHGLNQISKEHLDLFKLYRATKLKILFLLRLPSAKGSILNGLKVASGLSIVGAIVGEFIAGGGLGGLIDTARTQQRVDQVFAAVIISSVVGLLFISLVNVINKKFEN